MSGFFFPAPGGVSNGVSFSCNYRLTNLWTGAASVCHAHLSPHHTERLSNRHTASLPWLAARSSFVGPQERAQPVAPEPTRPKRARGSGQPKRQASGGEETVNRNPSGSLMRKIRTPQGMLIGADSSLPPEDSISAARASMS